MKRPRIIASLLLCDKGLVKTKKFNKKNPTYIGDPINAVRIFNDLKADELIFLDIKASLLNKSIDFDLVRKIGDEAYMPFSVGGGITKIEEVDILLKYGAEKVVINSGAVDDLNLIDKISSKFGSQSIIFSLDHKSSFFGKNLIYTKCGKKKIKTNLLNFIKDLENAGAGEIMVQSIERDGMKLGYDSNFLNLVNENTTLPVTVSGGCSSLNDMKSVFDKFHVSGVAAGSLFVFHGARDAVLINYPTRKEINNLFELNEV